MQRSKRLSNQCDVKSPNEKGILNILSKSQAAELCLPKCTLVPLGTGWRGREGAVGGRGRRLKKADFCV